MSIPEGTLYQDGILSAGRIAEHHPAEYITTKIAEGVIPFGRAVVKGTGDNDAVLPSAADDVLLGVAGFSTEAGDIDNEQYSDNDPVAVVETGIVVVYVEEAVSIGDPVRIRHAAATGKVPGSFAVTAEAAKTALVSNAQWKSETTGAGLAQLYINGPFSLTADVA